MAPLSAQSLAQSLAQTTPQMGAMTTLMRLMLLLQGRLAEVVRQMLSFLQIMDVAKSTASVSHKPRPLGAVLHSGGYYTE